MTITLSAIIDLDKHPLIMGSATQASIGPISHGREIDIAVNIQVVMNGIPPSRLIRPTQQLR